MQAFGRGVSRPANGGGPGGPGKSGGLFGGGQKVGFSVSKADNINPEAQDCYFYYYSTCAKVSLSLTAFSLPLFFFRDCSRHCVLYGRFSFLYLPHSLTFSLVSSFACANVYRVLPTMSQVPVFFHLIIEEIST